MKNRGYSYSDRILQPDAGVSVTDFYSRHYPHSTEETWRLRIQEGQVLLNGRPPSPDDTLTRGDRLIYHRLPWEEPEAPTDFETLFEDGDVLVLAKPSGLPVLPGGLFLENTLLYLARQRYGAGCSPLHRLGRGTSGAILFTRNGRAARSLAAAMVERRILKVYLALASGTAMPDTFTVDAPIGPVPYRRPANVHAYRPDGRSSISHVRVIRRLPDENATLLEVTIPTGRPHQIRIHLSYAGCPLVGDPLYQSGGIPRAGSYDEEFAARPGDIGYFLHSWKIRFPHPERGENVVVVCPPPPNFILILQPLALVTTGMP
ncbi:MAG: RluA family pseudouridine synthase [Candidatus Aminicenantes bacterium]|nr:RluA family pseudouridine synthase [Candidatus Aminicenantes bacterium]